MERLRTVRIRDVVLMAAAVAAALLSMAALWLTAGGGAPVAVVTDAQGEVARIRLDEVREGYDLPVGGHVTLRVEPGKICFAASDCPDGLCVKAGWISRAGETAICLPERVSVRVTGEGGTDETAY